MKTLVPIGPRFVGKTSVAKALAAELGERMIDSDEQYEMQYGPISSIDLTNNEEARRFREREANIIANLAHRGYKVLSIGGGAVAHQFEDLRKINLINLERTTMIYLLPEELLRNSAHVCTDRWEHLIDAGQNDRPRLTDDNELYGECLRTMVTRHPLYLEASRGNVVYTKGMTPREVAHHILDVFAKD